MSGVESKTKKIAAKLIAHNDGGIIFEFTVPLTITAGQLGEIIKARWNKLKEETSSNPYDRCTSIILFQAWDGGKRYADTDILDDCPDGGLIMFYYQ